MAKQVNASGARGSAKSGASGKSRSPTSNPHTGSRVEPSHITEKKRTIRATKAKGKAK